MPTPFVTLLSSGHEVCEMADELIHDDSMHLGNLLTEDLLFLLVGGLTPKSAESFGFGKVEKKSGTDALAYLGRLIPERQRDLDTTVFLVKISHRWWQAAALDVKNGATIRRQNLHHLLCSIVPSETGGTVAKPDITIFTEQIAAFGPGLIALESVNKLLERFDSGGQEQLPLDETGEEKAEAGESPAPSYPALADGGQFPLLEGTNARAIAGSPILMIEGSAEGSEIIEGEIVETPTLPATTSTLPDWLPAKVQYLVDVQALGRGVTSSFDHGAGSKSRPQKADEILKDIEGLTPNAQRLALAMIEADCGGRVCRVYQGQINMGGLVSNEACRILTGGTTSHGLVEWWDGVPELALPHLPEWIEHVSQYANQKSRACAVKGWEPRAPISKKDELPAPEVSTGLTDEQWEQSAKLPDSRLAMGDAQQAMGDAQQAMGDAQSQKELADQAEAQRREEERWEAAKERGEKFQRRSELLKLMSGPGHERIPAHLAEEFRDDKYFWQRFQANEIYFLRERPQWGKPGKFNGSVQHGKTRHELVVGYYPEGITGGSDHLEFWCDPKTGLSETGYTSYFLPLGKREEYFSPVEAARMIAEQLLTDKFGVNGTGKEKKSTASEGNGGSRKRREPAQEPSALFNEGEIAPALSATQQANNFADQLVGGGA